MAKNLQSFGFITPDGESENISSTPRHTMVIRGKFTVEVLM
jgi:hypothetical protein